MSLATACGAGAPEDVTTLAPADADIIGSIKVAEILKDDDINQLLRLIPVDLLNGGFRYMEESAVPLLPDQTPVYSPLPLEEPRAQATQEPMAESLGDGSPFLEWLLEEASIGVDFRNVTNFTFFAELSEEASLNLILKGSFQQDMVESALQKQSGEYMDAQEYKGVRVLIAEQTDMAVAWLGDDTLLLGNMAGVLSVIDVRAGDEPALTGPLLDAFNELDDDLVKLSVAFPDDLFDQVDDQSILDSFGLPSVIQGISGMTVSAGKEDSDFAIDMALHFENAESAERSHNLAQGLLLIYKGVTEGAAAAMADQVRIGMDENTVSIAAQASVSQIEDLYGSLDDFGGF